MSGQSVRGGMEVCDTTVRGKTLQVLIKIKDRPGFLLALLERIYEFDPMVNVDSGHSQLTEEMSLVYLVLRSHAKGHHPLDDLGMHLQMFKDPPGRQSNTPAAILRVRLSSPNEPGGLLKICQCFSDMEINIVSFKIEPFAGITLRTETDPDDSPQQYTLQFELAVPDESIDIAVLEDALKDLGVKVIGW